MLSVDDAHATILDNAQPLPSEQVALGDLTSRVASADVLARLTQPPFRASAMDGYAIAFDDIAKGTTFKVVGKASAGVPFQGRIGPHQAVRIFTGSIVPIGADHVVIQEDVQINGKYLKINTPQAHPRNIRNEGIDFEKGDVLARAGDVFHALHGSLFAAANLSNIGCVRRPRVAIFTNGDELREPGSDLAPGEIVNSNYYAIVAMLHAWLCRFTLAALTIMSPLLQHCFSVAKKRTLLSLSAVPQSETTILSNRPFQPVAVKSVLKKLRLNLGSQPGLAHSINLPALVCRVTPRQQSFRLFCFFVH